MPSRFLLRCILLFVHFFALNCYFYNNTGNITNEIELLLSILTKGRNWGQLPAGSKKQEADLSPDILYKTRTKKQNRVALPGSAVRRVSREFELCWIYAIS